MLIGYGGLVLQDVHEFVVVVAGGGEDKLEEGVLVLVVSIAVLLVEPPDLLVEVFSLLHLLHERVTAPAHLALVVLEDELLLLCCDFEIHVLDFLYCGNVFQQVFEVSFLLLGRQDPFAFDLSVEIVGLDVYFAAKGLDLLVEDAKVW